VSEACAAIVARDDPRLHATALFAPEPGRSRLMALYAFDIELSRAAGASAEPLIARMRLQWWRDIAKAALAGAEPPVHEMAGPFARLVRGHGLPAQLIEAPIAAREAELDVRLGGRFDADAFARWTDARFGALAALAAHLLTAGDAASVALARRAGPVLGAAFALRHAGTAPAADRLLLPGLTPEDRAALARGETTEHAREVVARVAAEARDALAALRRDRGLADRRAVPALLPLVGAGRVLARAAQPGAGLRDLDDARPFAGLRLALAAATARW
jgi:phytoene/squalene synthetase